MLISIVGKSGSGKSTIAKELAKYDNRVLHVDIDQISHYVLTLPEVKEKIQKGISYDCVMDGEVQRKVLGRIVFANPEQMKELTNITWESMEKIIDQIITDNKDKLILLDWLLLPKTKYFEQSNLRIWVEAPIEERVKRTIKRDNITEEYFLKRDGAGIDYAPNKYDYVINNISQEKTNNEVKKIYEKSILRR